MLDINPEIVCLLIGKLREFHAKEEVTIPEVPTSPSDDWARQVLADHADDFCYQEIVDTVHDLEPIQQVNLVALLWLGRGDYDIEEWDEVVAEAKAQWTPRTAEYLAATPLVADYLEEALGMHGHSCQA
jgi:hypothetical protein